MYLPARLISVPWGTTDKCYRFSFDLFTAAVDRDSRACTKKTPRRFLPIETSRSTYTEVKTKRNIKDYTLTNIVFDDDE